MNRKNYLILPLFAAYSLFSSAADTGADSECLTPVKKAASVLSDRSPFPTKAGKPLFISETLFRLRGKIERLKDLVLEREDQLETDTFVKTAKRKELKDKYHRTKDIPKKLTSAEISLYETQIKESKADLTKLEKEEERLEELDRVALFEFVKRQAKKNSDWRKVVEDELSLEAIKGLDPARTVSLLLGNSIEKPSEILNSEAEKLARKLVKSGYTVLYDADSLLAKTISQAAGKQGVGVTGGQLKTQASGRTLNISNPFSRMQALGAFAKKVIVSPDSLAGNAILFWGRSGATVLDPSKNWQNPYRNWYTKNRELVGELGVHYEHVSQSSRTESFFEGPGKISEVRPQKEIKEEGIEGLKNFRLSQLQDLAETADTIEMGKKLMRDIGGAVYFGSSGPTLFDKEIDSVAEGLSEMGIPAVTGGAGGTMKRVNKVAYEVGVPSVGIPLGGRNTLSSEPVTFNNVHTMTIGTGGYETRIPLLAHNRGIIVMNPGGSGTMQEIATVLSSLAADSTQQQKILFVGKRYYQDLLRNFMASPALPQDLKDRIAVVDTKQEAKKIVQGWLAKGEVDKNSLFTREKITPRNVKEDRSSFQW